MFTILHYFIGYVVEYILGLVKEDYFHYDLSDEHGSIGLLDDEEPQENTIRGVVTAINTIHGYGLVNATIYFDLALWSAELPPVRTGMMVVVCAFRKRSFHAFVAKTIYPAAFFWDETEDSAKALVRNIKDDREVNIMGRVTQWNSGTLSGIINDQRKFLFKSDIHLDIVVGDWLRVSLGDYTGIVTHIEHVREKRFSGKITDFDDDVIIVDEAIVIRRTLVSPLYSPVLGTILWGEAVESDQNEYQWRAVAVQVCDLKKAQLFKSDLKPRASRNNFPGSGNAILSNRGNNCGLNSDGVEAEMVIPGRAPTAGKMPRLPVNLPVFPVPVHFRRGCVRSPEFAASLKSNLSWRNYKLRLHTMLYLEELQMEENLKRYSMTDVCLTRRDDLMCMRVDGLSEGRPSLVVGDTVRLHTPQRAFYHTDFVQKIVHEGCVHAVNRDDLLLGFSIDFENNYNGESFDVTFHFNRTTLRRCHLAIDMVIRLRQLPELFPDHVNSKEPQVEWFPFHDLKLVNTALNESQRSAVYNVVLGVSGAIPYVIFGPPGTGKTVTVVECIAQIYKRLSESRILAVAPTNSAADLLAERLILSGAIDVQKDLTRMISYNYERETASSVVQQVCSDCEDIIEQSRKRIFISTTTTAGLLQRLGLATDHFTHVFVDECGQLHEPECLIALGLSPYGQKVLAGDPQQLGPVIQSTLAKEGGFDISLLQRLMDRPPYKKRSRRNDRQILVNGYDPRVVSKLLLNYRSKPEILHVYSYLFYDNELISGISPQKQDGVSDDVISVTQFPVRFVDIRGHEMQDADSPSWYNASEAIAVAAETSRLIHEEHVPIEQIAIITPYRQQARKIRSLMLSAFSMESYPRVGSVEEFQGQERDLIVMSTVRTSERLRNTSDDDVRERNQFVFNANRFNVAISRARKLLVIFGDSSLLTRDANWRYLIDYCKEHGAFKDAEEF